MGVVTMTVMAVIAASTFGFGHHSRAADFVCGDGTVDVGEQCDDGNLVDGDGCSSACTIEKCGNGAVDFGEQCDDGNLVDGDGCDGGCNLEFCGDGIVQEGMGEQCDDGNGVAGDGCASDCSSEVPLASSSASSSVHASTASESPASTASQASSSASSKVPPAPPRIQPPPHPPAPKPPPPLPPQASTFPPTVIDDAAQQGIAFIAGPEGRAYLETLTEGEEGTLSELFAKIKDGASLTESEKRQSATIADELSAAVDAVQSRRTELLRELISSPISSDVISDIGLKEGDLVGVPIPAALSVLLDSTPAFPPTKAIEEAMSAVEVAVSLGVALEQPVATEETSPTEAFQSIVALKQTVEAQATDDPAASVSIIRQEARSIRAMLPALERDYGLKPTELLPILQAIDVLSASTRKDDLRRLASTVDQLLRVVERAKVAPKAELFTPPLPPRDITEFRATVRGLSMDESLTPQQQAQTLAQAIPAAQQEVFRRGSPEAQRAELLTYLETNERVTSLREQLRKSGVTAMEDAYQVLRRDIGNVGSPQASADACSASMATALRCTADFLTDLETTAQTKSIFTEAAAYFQSLLGINQ